MGATLYHSGLKREFRVYNVQLDHEGAIAKHEGMKCVLSRVQQQERCYHMPILVVGDFNEESGGPVEKAVQDWTAPKLTDVTQTLPGTFHAYGQRAKDGCPNAKIDYILVTDDLKESLQAVTLWEEELNGHLLSDHYPVCGIFR